MASGSQAQGVTAILSAGARNSLSKAEQILLLAVAYVESGWRPNAVGDNGTSFGLFQNHIGGAGGSTLQSAKRFLNAQVSADDAVRRLKGVTTGAGAAAVQRPADPRGYAAKVDQAIADIKSGKLKDPSSAGKVAGATVSKPKWSPDVDKIKAQATRLGLRLTSESRPPARNAAAGGVSNSYHLSTRPEVWAIDFVGTGAQMQQLKQYADSLPTVAYTLIHDAGSGVHLHIQGKTQAGSASDSMDTTMTFGLPDFGLGGLTEDWQKHSKNAVKQMIDGVLTAVIYLVFLGLAAALIYGAFTRMTGTGDLVKDLAGVVKK